MEARRVRPRQERCYCPVPGCPAGDAMRAAGWQNVSSMRPHLEEHAGGRLAGDIPADFLEQNALGQCTVCSKLLSRRFGQTCPRCRPSLRAASRRQTAGRPLPTGCPDLEQVFGDRVSVKTHVPKGARHLWSQCLLTALAAVVRYNDERAWTELFALPKMTLRGNSRGGQKYRKRAEIETKI